MYTIEIMETTANMEAEAMVIMDINPHADNARH
jgi:hypothetical protein